MARSMTFQINDASAGGMYPNVYISISEAASGQLNFSIRQEGAMVGDLRGLFFDLMDETLMRSISISNTTASSYFRVGDDTVRDLGNGVNMNGLLGQDGGFDFGIAMGTAGIGQDDIRGFSFSLAANRALTLDDVAGAEFGLRLTSVGLEGSSRSGSSKLLETTSYALNARDDTLILNENDRSFGNVLANDLHALSLTSLMGWSGGSVGTPLVLANAAGASLAIGLDGRYDLDASAADALSLGERMSYRFRYDAVSDTGDQTSQDDAWMTVVVVGQNDLPHAEDDDAGMVAEDGQTSGNVLANDWDVDRLDSLVVAGVENGQAGEAITLASGARVTVQANGAFQYDTNGAFDHLNTGESYRDSFICRIADQNGGMDQAVVSVVVQGRSPVIPPPPSVENLFPTMRQAISNVVLYLDDDNPATPLEKVKLTPEGQYYDVDDLHVGGWIRDHQELLAGRDRLVAVAIHAGVEYPLTSYTTLRQQPNGNWHTTELTPLGPGEGQLYLFGDDTPIAADAADYRPTAAAPGPSPTMLARGLTADVLAAPVAFSFMV